MDIRFSMGKEMSSQKAEITPKMEIDLLDGFSTDVAAGARVDATGAVIPKAVRMNASDSESHFAEVSVPADFPSSEVGAEGLSIPEDRTIPEAVDAELVIPEDRTIIEQEATTETAKEAETAGELESKTGGAYKDLPILENCERHHIPAKSASDLAEEDGPCIIMEKGDHRQTASYGSSKEAREYREKQKELIEQGKFKEAQQMDIDDIHEKFGDKYDDAIQQAEQYTEEIGR